MTALEQLPARVDNLTSRVDVLTSRVDDLTSQVSQLRTEVRNGFSAADAKLQDFRDDLGRQMRILHEDLIERIKALGEGNASKGK